MSLIYSLTLNSEELDHEVSLDKDGDLLVEITALDEDILKCIEDEKVVSYLEEKGYTIEEK